MFTFTFIEDYLEVLAGFRDVSYRGQAPSPITNFFNRFSKQQSGPVALARYDVSMVHSLAESTITGKALTDKQSELAIRLVSKYKKQFSKLNVNVEPSIDNPKFRHPTRLVDRSKTAFIRDDKIVLKFPYNKELVEKTSTASKESKGSFKFNFSLREWHLAITESNVNWICSLKNHGFDISSDVLDLMQLVLECEKNDFKIELCCSDVDNTVYITNAEITLLQYVENKLGGFSKDNLLKLADYSPLCGYTVNSTIRKEFEETHGSLITEFILNKDCHYMRYNMHDNKDLLVSLKEYSNLTNRWPIYVYEPESEEHVLESVKDLFNDEEIMYVDKKINLKNINITQVKIVYSKKLKYINQISNFSIPILLSTTAMLIGFDRQSCLLNSDKIVYYTATTYNKEIKTIASNNSN